MEILYSHIEDDWSSADECIEEVATIHFADISAEESKDMTELTLFKGVKAPQNFDDFLCIDSLVEHVNERAYEECGEHAEGYLASVSADQKDELRKLICQWADKHELSPNFFMVEQIKEVKFSIPKEWHDNA